MERTLTALRQSLEGDVYILLQDAQIGQKFLRDAEDEGFTIGGDKPTVQPYAKIMALHDGTISYVGFVGNVRFGCVSENSFHRIDYAKFAAGENGYVL